MSSNDGGHGGPAFPLMSGDDLWDGMSLRDYFAAAAIQGLALTPNKMAPIDCAKYAYAIADAMLEARVA